MFQPGADLRILIMNVEAFSSGDGPSFAHKFLSSHPKSMIAIDEATTIKTHTTNGNRPLSNCVLGHMAPRSHCALRPRQSHGQLPELSPGFPQKRAGALIQTAQHTPLHFTGLKCYGRVSADTWGKLKGHTRHIRHCDSPTHSQGYQKSLLLEQLPWSKI